MYLTEKLKNKQNGDILPASLCTAGRLSLASPHSRNTERRLNVNIYTSACTSTTTQQAKSENKNTTSWPQRSPPTGAHLPAPARRPLLCLRPGRRSSCRPDWAPTRTRCCKHCHGPRRQADLGFPGEGLWPDPMGHRQRSKVTGTVTFDRQCRGKLCEKSQDWIIGHAVDKTCFLCSPL